MIRVFDDKESLGKAAADRAAEAIQTAIQTNGKARVIAATGASQFEFLAALVNHHEIDWKKVELFHLDEYVGLPATHPASFRKYLQEHLISKTGIDKYHFLDGASDPAETIRLANAAISAEPIDIAFVGIGENGHLAFNDPPADFDTEEPFIIVKLDEPCRRQQVSEGWFPGLADVPETAISMSVRQMLKAKEISAVVPDTRKAPAVKACLEGDISPLAPASILRTHPNTTIYLDRQSAALLNATA